MLEDYKLPQLLEDMRFIYSNPEEHWLDGCKGTELTLRLLHRNHPAEFLDRLDRMEREYARAIVGAEKRRRSEAVKAERDKEAVQQKEVDEGTERAIALCEEYLHKLKAECEANHAQGL